MNNNTNTNCKICNYQYVEIEISTLNQIIETLNPNFKSLPKNWKKRTQGWIRICPKCDTYALGIELIKGFPFRTLVDHQIQTIQDIQDQLYS